jgi:putative tryptophan/tyrosine transport system substrate-binding protein
MRFKVGALVVTLAILSAALAGEGQHRSKAARIGILCPITCSGPSVDAFRQELRELGYTEGRDIALEFRSAEGAPERLPDLAAELIGLVDVIYTTWGTGAALAAKQATTTIPIVMGAAGDPVVAGLVTSLARPGGNITGVSSLALELEGKRLELLKELLRKVSRVAVLWDSANPYSALAFKQEQIAAQALGLKLQPVRASAADAFAEAFAAISNERPEALVVHAYIATLRHRHQIVQFAAQKRLPAVYPLRDFVDAGGLLSYGASLPDISRRAATYVDKILKGSKPADLPVEQPTKFELVVNMRTAKALGLTIPPSILIRADQIIE